MASSQTYLAFVDFVKKDSERERAADTRRLLGLLFWCFLAPALVGGLIMILNQKGVISVRWRGSVDLIMILFPVLYSLYVLSRGFFRDLPRALKHGNLGTVLDSCAQEARWREDTVHRLKKAVQGTRADWKLLADLFQLDLDSMLRRSRYLIVLAGAIFYLLMQGIDSIGSTSEQRATWVRDPEAGWVEARGDELFQVGGLGLFLILLYLSGSQTHHSLQRYQACARQLGESSWDSTPEA